jgi:conjugative transfer signal peptidase TraF
MTRGGDAPHAHSARTRPAWTTRRGGRALRARRTAPPGGATPAPGARCPRRSLVLGLLVLAAVVSTRWVRVNVSPSVPRGLYRLMAVTPPLSRGTLVLFPAPAVVRPWWSSWVPFLKPVAAVAGDEVCVQERTLWVAGTSYGPVYAAAQGKVLPHLEGCQVVPEGAVFLASQEPRSLDGRYWGMTPIATLTTRAVPLLTWR